MKRITKKIIAIVLTIALVVSTMSIQPNTARAAIVLSEGWAEVGNWELYSGSTWAGGATISYEGDGSSFADMSITITTAATATYGIQFGYNYSGLESGKTYDYSIVINSSAASTIFTQVPGTSESVQSGDIGLNAGDNTLTGSFTYGTEPANGTIMIFPCAGVGNVTFDMVSLTITEHISDGNTVTNTWTTVGNWHMWADTANAHTAEYEGEGTDFGDMSFTITGTQSWEWGHQYGYTIAETTLVSGTQYDYTMVINSTAAGTLFTQVPGIVQSNAISITAGDNTITGSFTAGTNPSQGNIMIFPNGMPAGTTLDMVSLTITEHLDSSEPIESNWVEIGEAIASDNTYYYDNANITTGTSVVNLQQPNWGDVTVTGPGIYVTVSAAISSVSVNGNTTDVAAIQGSGALIYLSALSEGENTVSITHANGTSTVTIKQVGSSEVETETTTQTEATTQIETTTEATADDDGYYPITANNDAFYAGNGTWKLYSANDADKRVWGSGIMKYKGGTSDSDLSLKIVEAGSGAGSWNLQAHYYINGLTINQIYTYTVTYTTSSDGTMLYKIDGNGDTDMETKSETAGTVIYSHTFTASKTSDTIVFDLSGMPTGTIISFQSIELETSGETVTTADSSSVTSPEDVPASSWKLATNTSTIYYYVTDGNDSKCNVPIMQTTDLYCAIGIPGKYSSVTFDGADMTPSDGAYVYIPQTNLTVGYHTLIVVDYYGTQTVTMYFKVEAEAETTAPETTTIPDINDGEEILKDTAFEDGNVTNWNEYGGTSWTNNGDDDSDGYGSVEVSVPAYTAGDNWATQLVQNNIQLYEGKWYVARFTVSSDVAKTFQLLIQSDGLAGGDWSVLAQEIIEVTAGGEVTFEIQFQATTTTNTILFGIMMGYVNGTACDAAKVTLSDVSLKVYNTEQQISGSHSNLLTSSDIFVKGFQMKTNWDESYTGDTQFGIRTVCQTPNIGESIIVNNVTYTVAKVGAIYTIEPDYNAPEDVVFDSTCTLLHYDEETGEYLPNVDIFETKIEASEKGIVSVDGINATYVQTIEALMKQFPVANKIHARAYIITTGGTIIYSQKSVNTSVARAAAYMYNKSMATNIAGHQYLFNNFVNVENFTLDANSYFETPKANPYYSTTTVAYGWNDNLYTPDGEHYMNLKPDVYLEDDYMSATTGYDGDPASVNTNTRGGVISIAGLKFSQGISTNAIGYFEYEVPYNASYFVGIVGIDDSINPSVDSLNGNSDYVNGATITCEVSFDGAVAYTTEVLSYGQLEYIKVPVPTGASTIKITFGDGGDGIICDRASMGHAGWMIDESIDDKYDTSNDPKDITRIYVYTEDDNPLITKENKTPASITIVSGEDGVNSVADSGTIKLRGNSTSLADKPAYNISFSSKKKVFENANSGKKWCLLANAFDKTLLRNKLATDFGAYLGNVATPESHYVDLYINGKLQGSYLMSEPAENGRSGIEYDEDNDTDMLFELEAEKSENGVLYNVTGLGVRFAVEDVDATSAKYANYLTTLVTFENALKNTTSDDVFNLIDVDSFVDMYIVNELFKTVDFGYSSVKFYIKADENGNPIIHAGSLWDFDLSTGNSSVAECRTTEDFRGQSVNTWFGWLMKNETFKNKVITKFADSQETIQNIYQANSLGDSWIEQYLDYMGDSKDRNYSDTGLGGAGWNINTPDSAEYKYYPYGYNTLSPYINYTYEQHINYLVNWLSARNTWMCGQWNITIE